MGSRFIKGNKVRCLSCGSSLLRKDFNGQTGAMDKHCFVCGAGEIPLKELEVMGLDMQTVLAMCGREPGEVGDILPRINTPGKTLSSISTSDNAMAIIKSIFNVNN